MRESDKSEHERTVVQVDIPIITGRVPMVPGIQGNLQTRKPNDTRCEGSCNLFVSSNVGIQESGTASNICEEYIQLKIL